MENATDYDEQSEVRRFYSSSMETLMKLPHKPMLTQLPHSRTPPHTYHHLPQHQALPPHSPHSQPLLTWEPTNLFGPKYTPYNHHML